MSFLSVKPITQSIPTVARSRTYAALSGHLAQKPSRSSDLAWILAATAVFVPTMGYLMSPRAAQHSSTSHAHPVEDKWSRSFPSEHLDAAKQHDRPIMADDDRILPAGEGRPHGPGDKSIRQITKPTETHASQQVSMHKDAGDIRGPTSKTEQARAQCAEQYQESNSIDTKAIQARVAHDNKEKIAQSKAQKSVV